jgi:hypothetical protein
LSGIGNYKNPSTWTTIDVQGATFTQINSISATGQIAGYYIDEAGTNHGFVGTPAEQ